MRKIIAVLTGFIACHSAFAAPSIELQNNASQLFWQDVSSSELLLAKPSNQNSLKSRSLQLEEEQLKALLTGSSLSARPTQATSVEPSIDLPLPNGDFVRVKASLSAILSPEMALKYPEIKTWQVVGVDDPAITGRLDFTSKGFHGMLIMPDGDTVYIDPQKGSADSLYQSLRKSENTSHFETEFNCKIHGDHSLLTNNNKQLSAKKLAQIPSLNLITYRLAIAGTAEFTASQGGTASSSYASMITTINRVNQIYQRDLGVKFQVVSDSALAYTDSTEDPYTNGDAEALVAENIANINSAVGISNYDLGHVFAQGSLGGLAYVGAACYSDFKAGGATGIPNPQGEIFSIEYVSHEIGHQLGAHHSFNSQLGACSGGSRTEESAVEPGSGSTIMSYTGLCDGDNLQFGSDAMFHLNSINEINTYTRSDFGATCGTRTSTGSELPTANAGSDMVIPLNTPFLLDGTASSGSVTWDQMDKGSASAVNVDLGNNAIIRTLLPVSNPDRYIPRLSNLFSGNSTIGEKLPQTVRDINFAMVVRNGGIATDLKKISVTDTGASFKVLSHANATTLFKGQTTDIAWGVASTDISPINCSKVNLQLIRVDGVKNMLLANTNNDGSEQVVVPASTPLMTNARIMVECASQPFFQISSGNIAVKKGTGEADTQAPVITIIGAVSIEVLQGSSYTDQGASAVDNIDSIVSVVSTGVVNTGVLGTYTITYSATDVAGNNSVRTRSVKVVEENTQPKADTTKPIITLEGDLTFKIVVGEEFKEPGFSAVDDQDGTVAVLVTGVVDTKNAGIYTLSYTAKDSTGNTAVATRSVVVSTKNTTGEHATTEKSGGGSMGFFLLVSLGLMGLRRRFKT